MRLFGINVGKLKAHNLQTRTVAIKSPPPFGNAGGGLD